MGKRIFVISDLHMAAEGCGFFSAQGALASFIEYVTRQQGEVDLVILGGPLDRGPLRSSEGCRPVRCVNEHRVSPWLEARRRSPESAASAGLPPCSHAQARDHGGVAAIDRVLAGRDAQAAIRRVSAARRQ